VIFTGNPVRKEIVDLPPAETRLAARSGPIRLLVIGGSLGALKLNTTVAPAVARLAGAEIEIWHQCGARHLDATRGAYDDAGVTARIEPFIEDMAGAYGWADLVVARAGALTVAELIQAGVAAVLVPYPHAVDDHQTANAGVLVDAGAARLIADAGLTGDTLAEVLQPLVSDRRRLLDMAMASAPLKTPGAARHVAAGEGGGGRCVISPHCCSRGGWPSCCWC
jgi:UDP-N-acetylglucosamine--N-acetylmuramyl-(pentapeptide) pyrophosphoryl-undecaprenol N-acetylglucosamine transferase